MGKTMQSEQTRTDRRSNKKRNGILIAFEGIDGTGKSTQIRLLAEELKGMGLEVVETREPTTGKYGSKIRELFVNREAVSLEEELRLFMEDRREHVEKLIEPALRQGKIVLTDRYYFSTAAYQGAAGHDAESILAANEAFAPQPDLVLLLTLAPAESVNRIKNHRNEALNDFEQENELRKVAAIFEGIQRDYIVAVNAAAGVSEVHTEIMHIVKQLLGEKGLFC